MFSFFLFVRSFGFVIDCKLVSPQDLNSEKFSEDVELPIISLIIPKMLLFLNNS